MNTPDWAYFWRRLHAQGNCRTYAVGYREEWHIDAGYCLDRYSIEHEPGVFIRVIP